MDADPGHDSLYLDGAPASSPDCEAVPILLNARNRITCHYFHTLFTIKVVQEMSKITREDICTDCLSREDNCCFPADNGQRSSDLRADKTPANNYKMISVLGHITQMFVVLKVPVINDVAIPQRQMIW